MCDTVPHATQVHTSAAQCICNKWQWFEFNKKTEGIWPSTVLMSGGGGVEGVLFSMGVKNKMYLINTQFPWHTAVICTICYSQSCQSLQMVRTFYCRDTVSGLLCHLINPTAS